MNNQKLSNGVHVLTFVWIACWGGHQQAIKQSENSVFSPYNFNILPASTNYSIGVVSLFSYALSKNEKMKVRSLREKEAILAEASSEPSNLKATAQKYGIQPFLISHRKKSIFEQEA